MPYVPVVHEFRARTRYQQPSPGTGVQAVLPSLYGESSSRARPHTAPPGYPEGQSVAKAPRATSYTVPGPDVPSCEFQAT